MQQVPLWHYVRQAALARHAAAPVGQQRLYQIALSESRKEAAAARLKALSHQPVAAVAGVTLLGLVTDWGGDGGGAADRERGEEGRAGAAAGASTEPQSRGQTAQCGSSGSSDNTGDGLQVCALSQGPENCLADEGGKELNNTEVGVELRFHLTGGHLFPAGSQGSLRIGDMVCLSPIGRRQEGAQATVSASQASHPTAQDSISWPPLNTAGPAPQALPPLCHSRPPAIPSRAQTTTAARTAPCTPPTAPHTSPRPPGASRAPPPQLPATSHRPSLHINSNTQSAPHPPSIHRHPPFSTDSTTHLS